MDLFAHARRQQIERESPLANRMRPRTLDEFVGQEHIVGPGRLLRRAIQADQLSSLIFYGPPGTGKTTLAAIIANHTQSHFITINAVLAGVKEIREAIADAMERRQLYNQRTTLFVDEVHRWNKAQQDALLPHVENGTIILIGATTENPYFEVNKALVSRSRIFQLRPLNEADLRQIARAALADPERGYGQLEVELTDEALNHLVNVANGDARGVLNALELAVETTPPIDGTVHIDLIVAEESIQRRAVLYDKDGDVHYDTISAFIKSVRGSDPDAALYWMARMLYAGEDPRFIFRRMAILAGEDIGLADPQAAVVVNSCWELYEKVGLPEGRFHLAQAALYLATCPKSNSTMAFFDALGAVEREQEPEVPTPLKDGNRDAEGFGHGQGYLYPHAYRDHWVAQQYLPAALQGKLFYQPSDQGYERGIQASVARRREAQLAAMLEGTAAAPAEVLTSSPTDRGRDAWLARAAGARSAGLAAMRDRLFALAAPRRHELLLVVAETTGLLAWEAVRRAPEGGVWVLAADDAAGDMLRGGAERLPPLERPQVLVGDPADLARLMDLRGQAELRFDCLLGRNLFTEGPDAPALAGLAAWLAPGGRLCLAQAVPRRGQRLSALLEDGALPAALLARVRAAEDALYADPDDPMTRWDAPELLDACADAGLAGELSLETLTTERRLDEGQLERWLAPGPGEDGRPSYAARLADAGLAPSEITRVAAAFRARLAGRSVAWQTTTAYLLARRSG